MAKKSKRSSIQGKKKELKKIHKKKLGLAKFISGSKKKHNESLVTAADKPESFKAHSSKTDFSSKKRDLSLLDRCKLQMSSSMLRLIDEDLYKSDSRNISLNRDKFLAYHKAYSDVSDKWPIKPVDYLVKFIKRRIIGQRPVHKFKFADVGCGSVPLLKTKLPPKARVLSFDLVSTHKDVIEANMASLPVDAETIDCAVYSLSLMAKNLGQIILEGKRILKMGGSMLIVEVTSRFESKEKKFIAKMDRMGMKNKTANPLEPNGYFTFFHFTKIDSELNYHGIDVRLKPCAYKAR